MPINPVAAQAKKRAARTVTAAVDCIVAVESPLFFVELSVGSFADQAPREIICPDRRSCQPVVR